MKVSHLKAIVVVMLAFLTLPYPVSGQVQLNPSQLANEVNQFVEAYNEVMSFARLNGVVLVGQGDEIIFEASYGLANAPENTSLTTDSIFNIGSIGKYYTIAAIESLEDKGLLSLTDPINAYIYHPKGDKITILDLLSHTSGLKRDDYDPLRLHEHITFPELVEEIVSTPLDFSPGERFQYSNWGFILAAQIIQQVSGVDYNEYLQTTFFTPLALVNTGVDMGNDPSLLSSVVAGHRLSSHGMYSVRPYNLSWFVGAGNIYTNSRELFAFYRAFVAPRILSAVQQGIDLGLPQLLGHRYTAHGGRNEGFQSFIHHFPYDGDVVIILLTNLSDQDIEDMTTGLAAIAFGDDYRVAKPRSPYEISAQTLTSYEGLYRFQDGSTVRVIQNRDGLWIPTSSGNRYLAESDTLFYCEANPFHEIEFVLEEDGQIRGFSFRKSASETFAVRL